MMTLGPALLLLAAFERVRGHFSDVIATFGRVPFFYYLCSPLSHSCACVGGRMVVDGRGGLALEWAPAEQARWLRLSPSRNLRGLAPGGGRTLSRVPLVCWREATQPCLVVELHLERRSATSLIFRARMMGDGPPSSRDSTINLPRHHAIPDLADSVLGVLFMVRRDYARSRG
jgi:hypothetical protein